MVRISDVLRLSLCADDQAGIAQIAVPGDYKIGRRRNVFVHPSREIEFGAMTWTIKTTVPFGAEIGGHGFRAAGGHAAQVGANSNRHQEPRLDRARGISTVCGLL